MDITENELLAELAAAYDYPPVDPLLDVTAAMVAPLWHISERAALERLKAKEAKGELVSHFVRGGKGHPVKAFRRP